MKLRDLSYWSAWVIYCELKVLSSISIVRCKYFKVTKTYCGLKVWSSILTIHLRTYTCWLISLGRTNWIMRAIQFNVSLGLFGGEFGFCKPDFDNLKVIYMTSSKRFRSYSTLSKIHKIKYDKNLSSTHLNVQESIKLFFKNL